MKTYFLAFGTNGDPTQFGGLSPTFTIFNANNAAVTPPSISAVTGATGFYSFQWGVTTPVVFMADAATTSPGTVGRYVFGSLDPADRSDEYGNTLNAIGVSLTSSFLNFGTTLTAIGSTQFAFGQSNVAIGTSLGANVTNLGSTLIGIGNSLSALGISNLALGNTLYALIGTTADSFGSTLTDPTSVFGFLKRAQELAEGNQTYTKATGILDLFSRGSSTLLREKTISDTSSTTTKT